MSAQLSPMHATRIPMRLDRNESPLLQKRYTRYIGNVSNPPRGLPGQWHKLLLWHAGMNAIETIIKV